jgi:hypothetical protein
VSVPQQQKLLHKLFTNEFEFDSTVTTVLDDTGEFEDVQLIIGDDVVYVRQFNDEKRETTYDLIAMSPKQWADLIIALGYTEGAFLTQYKIPSQRP